MSDTKPKRGRPRLAEGLAKGAIFSIRLSPDERGRIGMAAAQRHIAPSEWARAVLLDAVDVCEIEAARGTLTKEAPPAAAKGAEMGRPSVDRVRVRGPDGEWADTVALVDTGAVGTVIDRDTAERAGIACGTDRESEPLRIAGKRVPVCRRTVTLEIPDSDCKATMEVNIARRAIGGHYPSILGADFMERTGTTLDLRRGEHSIACDVRRRDNFPPDEKKVVPKRWTKRGER